MSSWRSFGLTLWALAAVTFTGCSTTSIPARAMRLATGQIKPGANVPFNRLVDIAETFENQGNFTKAQRMYNLVLSKNPNNTQASQGIRRIAGLRKNDGRVFEGTGKPSTSSPMNQPEVMLAGASGRSTGNVSTAIATTESVTDPRPKSVGALVASSTIPTRSTNRGMPFRPPTTTPGTTQQPGRAVAPEDWTLPQAAPSPVFANPEAGRVKLDASELAPQPFVMPASLTVQSAPATAINIEACLDRPQDHVPTLLAALNAADPEARSLAAFLIGEAGPAGFSGLPSLRSRLAMESSETIRVTVAESICKLDRSDIQARSVLIRSLTSHDAKTRSTAAFALRVFAGYSDQEVIRALVAALSDTNVGVVSMAALSLSDFGSHATAALPALEATKAGARPQMKEAIDAAIRRIKA